MLYTFKLNNVLNIASYRKKRYIGNSGSNPGLGENFSPKLTKYTYYYHYLIAESLGLRND